MAEDNLVAKLVQQHRGLQNDLSLTAESLKTSRPDSGEIDKSLKRFAADLAAHLELENNTFYVQLIEKMKEKGQDTAKTEEFIAEMGDIGKAVMAFLDKYSDTEKIGSQLADFNKELPAIISVLNLRIESEEAGVYAYWGLF